jgi:uncharacterized membrane protein YgcG
MRITLLALTLFASLIFAHPARAGELPALTGKINDFAGLMPRPSREELAQRLSHFTAQTGKNVTVLTVESLGDETLDSFGRKAFRKLSLKEKDLRKSVLLIIARKQKKVGIQVGSDLRGLFPEPDASHKVQADVKLYINGYRPDLGIHAAVNYIFRVIEEEVHVGRLTEEEKLEERSLRGGGAGALFAIFFAPYLAFVVGVLWGIYSTNFNFQREVRLFIGAVLSGGTAKVVAILMGFMGGYSDRLWYFILATSIPLGIFGSLTEFWMEGDWCAIPRIKDPIKRKPEDNMGI